MSLNTAYIRYDINMITLWTDPCSLYRVFGLEVCSAYLDRGCVCVSTHVQWFLVCISYFQAVLCYIMCVSICLSQTSTSTTQPVKTVVKCTLWLWDLYKVTLIIWSSQFGLGDKMSLTESLSDKCGHRVWKTWAFTRQQWYTVMSCFVWLSSAMLN